MQYIRRKINHLTLAHRHRLRPVWAAANRQDGVARGDAVVERDAGVQAEGLVEDVLEVLARFEGGEGYGA